MEGVDDKIEAIRESAIGLGLSDTVIDQCILNALKVTRAEKSNQTRNRSKSLAKNDTKPRRSESKTTYKSSKCSLWKLCKSTTYALIGIVIFSVGFYVIVDNNPRLQRTVMRVLEPASYSLMRWWRILTLPVAKTFDLTDYYDADCLVSNPLHALPSAPCDECQYITSVHVLDEMSEDLFLQTYFAQAQPVLIKKGHSPVRYDDLKSLYLSNKHLFMKTFTRLTVGPDSVNAIDDVFNVYSSREIRKRADFHVEWTSKAVDPSRLLRKLFPRPKFIPAKNEVGLMKTLYIDSASSPLYPWRHGGAPNMWYVQGSGSRKLYFVPHEACHVICHGFTITVNAGDLIHFHGPYWEVQSAPVTERDNTDISIGLIGSFS